MLFKFRQSDSFLKTFPKAQTQSHISPFVWAIFISSLILFFGSTFVTTWTSTRPTWPSVNQENN